MADQRIAKNRQQVTFTLADGSEVQGEVFLSLCDARHRGPQRVGELLNGEEDFIPVATSVGMVHLNIANIVTAKTSDKSEWNELEQLGKKYSVRIATLLGEESGEVFVNLPQYTSRVSDYLNQPARFYRLFISDHIVYIGARFILSVRD